MKKILSLILVFCITVSFCLVSYAVEYGAELKKAPIKMYEQKFSDVPENHWAYSYISEMAERGVLNGYPDGKFYPESQVTRAEFAKIMTTAAGLNIVQPTSKIFVDVQINEWYAPYVHVAKDYLGAYNQNGTSYYLPTAPALREDIAVALVKLKGYSSVGADMTALQRMFSDYQSISDGAKIYVASAIENGLVSGYDDGTFRGQNSVSRAEAAALLWRAYQYGNSNKIYQNAGQDPTSSIDNNTNLNVFQTSDESTEKSSTTNNTVEEVVVKPYVMDKLVSADLESAGLATIDEENNIYYIDQKDNCVYKISVLNGNKSKFFDPKKLSYIKTEEQQNDIVEEVTKTVETGEYDEIEEEITEIEIDSETGEEIETTKTVIKKVPITEEVTEQIVKSITEEVILEKYTSYVPLQVFYDNFNDKLLLNGYYENLVKSGQSPQEKQYHFIYDITRKSDVVYCIPDWDYQYNVPCHLPITAALNRDYFVTGGSNYGYKIDVETGHAEKIYMNFDGASGLKYGNDLFGFANGNYIYQYDFNENDCVSITEWIDADSFSRKDDCYYFWNEDGLMFKISVHTKMTTVLDINTKSENVDFKDMGNMKNIDEHFFVIDDETFVFYDTNMKAFRILKK